MAQQQGILGAIVRMFFPNRGQAAGKGVASAPQAPGGVLDEPGRTRGTETIEVRPPARDALVMSYAPNRDGDPDAGEIVWTWVPYTENDGRGKDRPVLVIGRQSADRVYAVRLTSKAHEGDRDFLPIGSGPWDSQGRPSWIDIEQVYSVHAEGMRREASALDLDRFVKVAGALQRRYGWSASA
ncbi:type II toxin-antitoxin system PemK/MazF family toxin [Microbacterium lacus]|uniref:type II toxin-antitoxin system PemK/MazF family toxin n=1 Tax=Microbacterium lacus TaxID=415217 RepID=UPI00384B29CA